MEKQQTIPSQISGFLSGLLRQHFGKGPVNVYVTMQGPFMVISLKGFLSSAEAILLKQQETRRVVEMRDLLMDELRLGIMLKLSKITGEQVTELYCDWNLENKSGVLIAVMDGQPAEEDFPWPADVEKDRFRSEIVAASTQAQRTPDATEIFWLSDGVVLIKRTGIFVQIEEELIKGGFAEELKIVKKPLECRMIRESNLDAGLKKRIKEIFVDWNFKSDKGYMVFVLHPS
ncbi:MAG TPA: Na-translocating system protein MpsC family protein [Planococcus sp. (in: firmicutes)]|nr:Na-translocating system protein MpsC family protein [Planococcus sp. (in: firmicutes)]